MRLVIIVAPLVLGLTEEKLLVGVLAADGAEVEKAGKEGDDLVARETGEAHQTVQRELALESVEQLADVVVVAEHGALRLLRLAPQCEVDGRGDDVLVVDADVGAGVAVFVNGTDGSPGGRGYGGNDDGASVGMIGVELDAGFGLAELVGGLVHHVDLLLAADAREVAVVANADEQAAAVGIGKGRY